jgi:hypothetical protein
VTKLERNTIGSVAILQECFDKLGRYGSCTLSRRSIQFEPEVILLAVGWYLRFSLSYRDVEELLAERGISVDHVTLWRYRGVLCAGVGAAPA